MGACDSSRQRPCWPPYTSDALVKGVACGDTEEGTYIVSALSVICDPTVDTGLAIPSPWAWTRERINSRSL